MRLALATLLAFVLVAAVAVGYPPLEVSDVGSDSITLGNLDCGTKYKVQVSERRNDRWRDVRTKKRTTNPCLPPAGDQYPNRETTGTPVGWSPTSTRSTSLSVTQPGAVIEDIRFTNGASIDVNANNVTIRRVELQGGTIDTACDGNTLIEDTSILPRAGQDYANDGEGVIGYGGYTARRVEIYHRAEGFRASNCGPVRVEDSWAQITPPQPCGDWHGDGLQGYYGDPITIRNVYLELDISGCGGTAPFFVPANQGNTSVDIDRLIVKGGGYPFRNGVAGSVSRLKVVEGSWVFGPVDVRCSVLSHWDAEIVTLDAAYQPTTVRGQGCQGSGT